MSENMIDGQSQEADIDDIKQDKDHDWSISRFSYERSSGEYFNVFNKNCERAKNLASTMCCQDETAVDCSEIVLEENIALNLFIDSCFDAEYNGRAMIVHGMGGCGKSKLIANINSVVRSCGNKFYLRLHRKSNRRLYNK